MTTKPEIVVQLIKKAIDSNLRIHDASHIVCDVKTKGFMFWKTTEIFITGRVDSEAEKAEIDQILKDEAAGFEINNTIRVHRR